MLALYGDLQSVPQFITCAARHRNNLVALSADSGVPMNCVLDPQIDRDPLEFQISLLGHLINTVRVQLRREETRQAHSHLRKVLQWLSVLRSLNGTTSEQVAQITKAGANALEACMAYSRVRVDNTCSLRAIDEFTQTLVELYSDPAFGEMDSLRKKILERLV